MSGVNLTPSSKTLAIGETVTLKATVAPADASDKTVSYASSNDAVATVDAKGVATGKTAGTADITVTTTDGAKTAKSTVTVTA